MIERLEGTFWAYQDAELYYQVWQPQTSVGTIIVSHGIAEHSDCYQRFAEDIAAHNWTVFVYDLRGHGRSEGKRGYVNRFQDYCDDLDAAIRFVKSQSYAKEKPLVLFGHSMGGLITLKTYVTHSLSGIQCLALSSPALGLTIDIPKLKEKAAHIMSDWLPKLTLHNEIDFRVLTRDENLVKEYKLDPLRHDKISPRLFLGMQEAFQEMSKAAPDIHIPIIMQLAGTEKVVSTPASEKVFSLLGSKKKELFIYTDSYHEIFNDLDRDRVIKDFIGFIK
ncbi:MAG: lysophospholipase [Bdellovibrionales bacterium]|nr:lysophospholipase [Bdellovibrionales bacterium]